MNKTFVLSSDEFESIKDAENKVNGWFGSGDLKKKTRLYKVVETYSMKIKFIKRKK